MESYETVARTSMIILLAWSLLSIGFGAVLASRFKQRPVRYFWIMTFLWGLVNLLIAGFALFNVSNATITADYIAKQRSIVGFNFFLDIGYIFVGYTLYKRGTSERTPMFGKAIVVQGLFLCLFDLILYQILTNY